MSDDFDESKVRKFTSLPNGDKMFMIHDIIQANGKTIQENNLTVGHKIPIGTLVEVRYDEWFGDGGCQKVHARLWVAHHDRDCDGTPLYWLSRWRETPMQEPLKSDLRGGFPEESLTVVEITPALLEGEGALDWDEDPKP